VTEAIATPGGWRLWVLFGVAAIGALLHPRPAGAQAGCITLAACFAGGNVENIVGLDGFCAHKPDAGASSDFAPICLGSPPPATNLNSVELEQLQNKLAHLEYERATYMGLGQLFNPLGYGTVTSEIQETENDIAAEQAVLSANGGHLGMYVSSGAGETDAWAGGGGAVVRGSGFAATDSAGILGPGTPTPSFKDVTGGGGITGSYDASRFLPTNQGLKFAGFFNYGIDNISSATPAAAFGALGVASSGSTAINNYTFGGSFFYNNNSMYLAGVAALNFDHGSDTFTGGTTDSFNGHGYAADLRIGKVFLLLNTISPGEPGMLTKAPPKAAGGGYALGLDVSGHLGHSNQQIDGYTDSSGFINGADVTRFWDTGGQVKLFAIIPKSGFVWTPYVAGTVDQQFGFSSTGYIPNQPALPGGDVVSLQAAPTFWGTQLGLDVTVPNGWIGGVNGFYQASADTNITGGSAHVRIPLNYTPRPVFATRY
jgi:hypothetical protein